MPKLLGPFGTNSVHAHRTNGALRRWLFRSTKLRSRIITRRDNQLISVPGRQREMRIAVSLKRRRKLQVLILTRIRQLLKLCSMIAVASAEIFVQCEGKQIFADTLHQPATPGTCLQWGCLATIDQPWYRGILEKTCVAMEHKEMLDPNCWDLGVTGWTG